MSGGQGAAATEAAETRAFRGDSIREWKKRILHLMLWQVRLAFVSFAVLPVVACASAAPRDVTTATAPVATAVATTGVAVVGTALPQTGLASAADWTVVRMEHVRDPERYRITVMLGGQTRTLEASRLCYEAAAPGQQLPDTIPSAGGYDIQCRVGD
jgi:hypothetical protein